MVEPNPSRRNVPGNGTTVPCSHVLRYCAVLCIHIIANNPSLYSHIPYILTFPPHFLPRRALPTSAAQVGVRRGVSHDAAPSSSLGPPRAEKRASLGIFTYRDDPRLPHNPFSTNFFFPWSFFQPAPWRCEAPRRPLLPPPTPRSRVSPAPSLRCPVASLPPRPRHTPRLRRVRVRPVRLRLRAHQEDRYEG